MSDSVLATVITRNCHFCRTRTWWINDPHLLLLLLFLLATSSSSFRYFAPFVCCVVFFSSYFSADSTSRHESSSSTIFCFSFSHFHRRELLVSFVVDPPFLNNWLKTIFPRHRQQSTSARVDYVWDFKVSLTGQNIIHKRGSQNSEQGGLLLHNAVQGCM